MKPETKETLTPKDVCSQYGASLPTVYSWLNRDDCPAFRLGHKWIIPRDLFRQWISDQATKGKS